ncbi:MAG TPA: hypothetical protein VNY36_08570, partial [Bacteroidia bacterium]|nr:hypothetical protein [Bacteroidia bacterium]
ATNYKITLAYEHGYLIYRVRGIGRDIHNPTINLYQAWSLADSNNVSNAITATDFYQVVTQHEYDSINYQYNATFAEEGKKKEVITYYDGSLRSREAVTKMNSDSNVLVGQTIYDFQGRPAVTVLPTPVKFPSCGTNKEPSIHYFPMYNQVDSAGKQLQYSRYQFDLDFGDSCSVGADSMSVLSGTSNYYSPENPRQYGFYAYIPDAHGYPFSQVQYTPDNTGRIKAQGGVGPQFQLGSGHETKYIYGQPNQLEMDRMFGEEMGDATHYKKNVVIDPNKQASISYLDQEGRTIATCLAGDPGTDSTGHNTLAPLPSQASALANLQVDLFAADANGKSNNNTVNIKDNAIVFNTQLTVAYQSNYSFNYTLQIDTIEIPCSSLCMNCVYNLQIQVLDDCGRLVTPLSGSNRISKVVGHLNGSGGFTTDCSVPLFTEADAFSVNLAPGNYTVSKTLTVDSGAVKYYIQQYENPANNSCIKSLSTFQNQYLNAIYADTCNCHITCSSCLQSLGNRDDFVANGKGTAEEYDFLYDQCGKPCKPVTQCNVEYQQMLLDMSPSGQYCQFLTSSGATDPGVFPVSVLNAGNALPANITSGGHGNWLYPQVILNGHTYPYYIDDKGNRSTIILTPSGGNYLPKVANTSLVYINSTTSQYYTYPENLANIQDFILYWQPTWAQSLVQYHPEYTYYLECQKYEVKQGTDTMSSETFDERMLSAQTFQEAYHAGFIVASSGDSTVANLFAAGTGKMYDPFITDLTFENDYGGSPNLSGPFTTAYNNYLEIGSSFYTMMQAAAITVRCGTNYSNTTTVPGTCTDFGQDMYAVTFPKLNQAIKDSEWNAFKNFY